MESPDSIDVSEPKLFKSEFSNSDDDDDDEDGGMEHEGHNNTCLVCSSLLLGVEEGVVQPWKEYCKWGQQEQPVRLMRWNLSSIFLLRKLLQYPSDKCAELLLCGGEEPGGWVSLCRKCSQLVLEALQAHEEIRELEAKIGGIGSQLRAEIGRSFPHPPGKLRKEGYYGASSSVHNAIRQFYREGGGPVEAVRKSERDLLLRTRRGVRERRTTPLDIPAESPPAHVHEDCDHQDTWSDDDDDDDDRGDVGPDPLYIPEIMDAEEEKEEEGQDGDVDTNVPPPPPTRRSNRLKGVTASPIFGAPLEKTEKQQRRGSTSTPNAKTSSSSSTKIPNNNPITHKSISNRQKGKRKDSGSSRECRICHKQFRCASQFQIHMRIHSAFNSAVFPCPICAHPTSCPNTRLNHFIRRHPKAPLPCSKSDCDFVTDNPYKYNSHDMEHTFRDALEPLLLQTDNDDHQPAADSFRCKLCCKSKSSGAGGEDGSRSSSGSWKTMTRHLKLVHAAQLGLEFFPCTVCPHVASRRREWRLHCLAKHHVRILGKEEVEEEEEQPPAKRPRQSSRGRGVKVIQGKGNADNSAAADNMPPGSPTAEEHHFHEDCDDDDGDDGGAVVGSADDDDPLFIPEIIMDVEQGDDDDQVNVSPPTTRRSWNTYRKQRGSTPKATKATSTSPTTKMPNSITKSIRDSSGPAFLCPICGHSSSNPNTRLQHLIRLHPKADLACPKCAGGDFVTDNPYTFTTHDTEHVLREGLEPLPLNGDDSDFFRCKLCDCGSSEESVAVHGSWVTMSRHLKVNHAAQLGLEFFPCTVCPYVAGRRREWKLHCLAKHQVRILGKGEEVEEEEEEQPPVKRRRQSSRGRGSRAHVNDGCLDDDAAATDDGGGVEEPENTEHITSGEDAKPNKFVEKWKPRRVSTRSSSAAEKSVAQNTRCNKKAKAEKESSSYKCQVCSKLLSSGKMFRIHLGIHSANNNVLFLCPICQQPSPSVRRRIDHIRRRHPKASLPCTKCDTFDTRSPYSYSAHETEHKIREQLEETLGSESSGELESSSFRCKLCDAESVSGSWASMARHMRISHSAALGTPAPFPCSMCDHVAFARRELTQHVLRIHHQVNESGAGAQDDAAAGESASAESDNPTNRQRLLLRHYRHKKWKCKLCPSSYPAKYQLDHHVSTTHDTSSGNRQLLECQLCEFKAAHRRLILCHMRANHGELYPHACTACGATFPTPQRLQLHQQGGHSGSGAVESCPHCGVKSKNKLTLKWHIRHRCKQRPPSALQPQMRERKKYERSVLQTCSTCGYKSSSNDAFAIHLQAHVIADHFEELPELEGESLARCKLCGKVCSSSQRTRYTHLNSKHASVFGVQSYQCQICGKGFNTHRRLRVHVNRHKRQENPSSSSAVDNKFVCEFCGAPFTSGGGVTKHCKTYHPEQLLKQQTHHDPPPSTTTVPSNPPPPPPPVGMKCKFCGLGVFHHKLLAIHLREEHGEQFKHQCDLCPAKYQLKQELTRHKASKHDNKTWKCEYCHGEYRVTKKRCSHVKRDCKAAPHRRRTTAAVVEAADS